MKTRFLMEFVLDMMMIFLLAYAAFGWLVSPAHQIPEARQQLVAGCLLIRISAFIFVRRNSDDDWAGEF
jgi:hypothetical protein